MRRKEVLLIKHWQGKGTRSINIDCKHQYLKSRGDEGGKGGNMKKEERKLTSGSRKFLIHYGGVGNNRRSIVGIAG